MNQKQLQIQKCLRIEQLGIAIRLLSAGKNERARAILKELICAQPDNVVAWLWLSETFPPSIKRIKLLELGLETNPDNPVLRDALTKQLNVVTAQRTENEYAFHSTERISIPVGIVAN
jgi:hypothetical protein